MTVLTNLILFLNANTATAYQNGNDIAIACETFLVNREILSSYRFQTHSIQEMESEYILHCLSFRTHTYYIADQNIP